VSRADAAGRITTAAVSLGVERGVGALTLQAIASSAGVSKALLLYHFGGKAALLSAVVAALGEASAMRLERALATGDAMVAWRALAQHEVECGELALLSALTLEAEVTAGPLLAARAAREASAAALATEVLAGVGLVPRVPAPFLGRLVLRQLDGLVIAARRGGLSATSLEPELDTFALALLALGR
jgi:AcrR family transcriptional regulator